MYKIGENLQSAGRWCSCSSFTVGGQKCKGTQNFKKWHGVWRGRENYFTRLPWPLRCPKMDTTSSIRPKKGNSKKNYLWGICGHIGKTLSNSAFYSLRSLAHHLLKKNLVSRWQSLAHWFIVTNKSPNKKYISDRIKVGFRTWAHLHVIWRTQLSKLLVKTGLYSSTHFTLVTVKFWSCYVPIRDI